MARGAGMTLAAPPCPPHRGNELVLCEEAAPGVLVELRADLSGVRDQLDGKSEGTRLTRFR